MMRMAVGADHAGYQLKEAIKQILPTHGIECRDVGAFSQDSVDYPDYAAQVAAQVVGGACDRGLLVCGTGIGMTIAANKIFGVRAALCYNVEAARLSRAHNDSNILVLGGRMTSPAEAEEIVHVWLATPFEGGRHQARLDKIAALEKHQHHQTPALRS